MSRYRWDRFEATARTVMARRDRALLTPGVATVLERLYATGDPTSSTPKP